jgi:hypothetical protein
VYATIDQRVQGSDEFAEGVLKKYEKAQVKPWKKEYTLDQLAQGIAELTGISPEALRSAGRTRAPSAGRCRFSLAAKDLGYKGVEIARYLEKEQASIVEYERKRVVLAADLKRLHEYLKKRTVWGHPFEGSPSSEKAHP